MYHVLNRAVARLPLFEKDADYAAFERVLALALEKHPIRLLAYWLMPNHWHFVLWPRRDGELSAFVRWLTHTHTMPSAGGVGLVAGAGAGGLAAACQCGPKRSRAGGGAARALARGMPDGSEAWARRTAARLRLEYILRARGRPKKEAAG